MLTEAENYLRRFIKKFKDFKTKGAKVPKTVNARLKTPVTQKRSQSKKPKEIKKNKSQLSSIEGTPAKQEVVKVLPEATAEEQENRKTTIQELGFLKEKLLICCNIVRKRLKPVDHKLDKKKGIRTDRATAG